MFFGPNLRETRGQPEVCLPYSATFAFVALRQWSVVFPLVVDLVCALAGVPRGQPSAAVP